MIVKSLGRKSGTASIIRYLLKPEKTIGKDKEPVIVRRNIRGKTEKAYVREFEAVQQLRINRRSNMNVCVHTVLSFNTLDASKVTNQAIRDISAKYMSLKGSGNLYLAVAHFNTGTFHIHIVESASNLKGQTARISKAEFAELKKELTLYQERRFPELSHSLPEHGKKENQKNKTLTVAKPYISPRTLSDKEAIKQCCDRIYTKSHSVKEFVAGIRDSGYEVYMRNGRVQGLVSNGLKHRFSKFGYTQEKFAELEQIEEKEVKLMKEFEAIRSRNTRAKEERDMEEEVEIEREIEEIIPEEVEENVEENDALQEEDEEDLNIDYDEPTY